MRYPGSLTSIKQRQTSARGRLSCALLLALLATISLLKPSLAAQSTATGTPTTAATIGGVELVVDGPGAYDANAIAKADTTVIRTAISETATIFGIAPNQVVTIHFVAKADSAATAIMRPIEDLAWASYDGRAALVLRDRFQQLSPAEQENLLRNIISRAAMQTAAGGKLPIGLMDGIARYIERPILADQARAGSLVQAAYQSGSLPDIPTLVNLGAAGLDPETATDSRYALAAFIINRYGVGKLQELVQSFATGAPWDTTFQSTLGDATDAMATAWKSFLPRWFSSGWQTNAVAAFDIAPAQALFDRGAYAAASQQATLSQQLFTELNDQENLSRVETLLALCAVGIQAETLMTETQQALDSHDYVRAQSLLDQANQQYALLPENHRPTQTIDSYESIAQQGLEATRQLDDATSTSHDWLHLRSSRSKALSAGTTFARLGDDQRAAAARSLLTSVDGRVRRLALILATLAVLLTVWFGVWVRSRAPLRFDWTR